MSSKLKESLSNIKYPHVSSCLFAVTENNQAVFQPVYKSQLFNWIPSFLFLPTDPCRWNSEQVKKWVEWTRHQYRLPEIEVGFFAMDGLSLCNLTDEQFRQLSPKSGDILYAHLDIWKNGKDG